MAAESDAAGYEVGESEADLLMVDQPVVVDSAVVEPESEPAEPAFDQHSAVPEADSTPHTDVEPEAVTK